MKIGTIRRGIDPLLDDAHESERLLFSNKDSQFFRRVYIRSIFAYIEGSIWVLKQVCLNARSKNGKIREITLAEFSILKEVSYDLKGNGDIKTGSKTINLLDNIKFTFKTINKLFNGKINTGIGTITWTKLIEAKNIRNRITHPRNEVDLTISDNEIIICEEICSWFNILIHESFILFIESGKIK